MARPANPFTPVIRQLQVIQARYKKLGRLIDKLTDQVNGSMKKKNLMKRVLLQKGIRVQRERINRA
jgi:hypothetical protein